MLFGRVKGTAVCTLKYTGTEGLKLLVVQPLNKRLEPVGALQVAADIVHAGVGDVCVMVRSASRSRRRRPWRWFGDWQLEPGLENPLYFATGRWGNGCSAAVASPNSRS